MFSITIIGDLNIDWIIKVKDINLSITSLWQENKEAIVENIGGSGLHFALACVKNGFNTTLISKIGEDSSGQYLLNSLTQIKINKNIFIDSNESTGKVIIFIDENDKKVMVSHRGANVKLSPDEISNKNIVNSDILYVSGYSLLECPQSEAVLKAISFAKNENIFTILDVVPHRIFRTDLPSEYIDALNMVDGIVIESGTAKRLIGKSVANENEIIEMLSNSYKFINLFPNNDVQIIWAHGKISTTETGYYSSESRIGYLDRIVTKNIIDYLEKHKR